MWPNTRFAMAAWQKIIKIMFINFNVRKFSQNGMFRFENGSIFSTLKLAEMKQNKTKKSETIIG